jgi:hypothetical protein
MQKFTELWSEMDPDQKYFIESFKFVYLLYNLPAPLGLKGREHMITRFGAEMPVDEVEGGEEDLGEKKKKKRIGGKTHVIDFIKRIGVRSDEYGQIFYLDALSSLVKDTFKSSEDLDAEFLESINLEIIGKANSTIKGKMTGLSGTTQVCDLTNEFNTASLIKALWKGKLVRRKFYSQLVKDGKWTDTLEHLFSVTLKLWSSDGISSQTSAKIAAYDLANQKTRERRDALDKIKIDKALQDNKLTLSYRAKSRARQGIGRAKAIFGSPKKSTGSTSSGWVSE